ncbi:MAG: sulfite exporter TauE/SafE family protein [Clostridiales bacterium]|nr:sulfite exporter TauE/SafE family protein [Clostridiales bacterium]
MHYFWIGIVSFLSGLTASLGLGGGFILVIYLTAFTNLSQIQAQGINLIFFIPIAVLSLILHSKNKLLDKQPLLPAILGGMVGVGIGFVIGNWLGSEWLSKLFAAFIFIVGLKELFHRKKTSAKTARFSSKNG